MATREPKRLSDGWLKIPGGVHSGTAPSDDGLRQRGQVSFAVNTAFRGGWPMPRPGWRRRTLDFGGDTTLQARFTSALFQDAGAYNPNDTGLLLMSMHGGRVFRVDVTDSGTFPVLDASITGDLNPDNRQKVWSVQAENYFIFQDNLTKPYIYNGASARRAGKHEIPVGGPMAYGMGRLWVARGREYVGGDIIFGPSGTAMAGYRDSILKFTENAYLNEGGAFGTLYNTGDITGLDFIENINTALGEGDLIVHTRGAIYANSVPADRESWKALREPIQRVVKKGAGSLSDACLIGSNGDMFFRSKRGIESVMFAVRNFGQPANTPISKEMKRVISLDDRNLLKHCSGVLFDNRVLLTCSPHRTPRGTAHRGLVALDLDPQSSLSEKAPPIYDGVWTGLNVLKIVTGEHNGVERCFIYAVNPNNEIELWELSTDDQFDADGDSRIEWSYETRSCDFGNRFDMKMLDCGDFFVDRVSGEVDFDVDYRPDGYPCWVDWETWSECSKTKLCIEDFDECPTLPNFQEQYRPKHQFKQPADTFDPILKTMFRTGYEFQFRFKTTGFCRHKQCRLNAVEMQELPHGNAL